MATKTKEKRKVEMTLPAAAIAEAIKELKKFGITLILDEKATSYGERAVVKGFEQITLCACIKSRSWGAADDVQLQLSASAFSSAVPLKIYNPRRTPYSTAEGRYSWKLIAESIKGIQPRILERNATLAAKKRITEHNKKLFAKISALVAEANTQASTNWDASAQVQPSTKNDDLAHFELRMYLTSGEAAQLAVILKTFLKHGVFKRDER